MKTATVTWTIYNNYGTLLQAYALQRFVESLGYENEILSDELILKEYERRNTKGAKGPPKIRMPFDSKSRIMRMISNPRRLGRIMAAHFDKAGYNYPFSASELECEEFKKKELKIRYGISYEKLSELNADYNAFICGSDQVWSVFESNFNPYYYLDFASKPKIAYAPSMGTDTIPAETAGRVKDLLADFDAVSVRERLSAEQLGTILGTDVEWTCDPTLLFDKTFWEGFAEKAKSTKGRYLLCYYLDAKPWYLNVAKTLAKKLGLRIKLIPSRWDYVCDENVIRYAVGPKEFVKLFQNSSFVLTDSYHGSIFSLLFEREFLCLQRFSDGDPNSQNVRIDSLFSFLGTKDRIIKENEPLRGDRLIHGYDSIREKLEEHRRRSGQYLLNSLHEAERKERLCPQDDRTE